MTRAWLLALVLLPVPAHAQAVVQVFKGTFTGATATGNQTVSGITDQNSVAFTPKFVFVWGTQQTSAATTDTQIWVYGMTDFTNQRTGWATAEDNLATSNANQSVHNARFLDTYDGSVANLSRATIGAASSGQFIVNWSVAGAGTAFLYHYIALGGTSFSAAVQTFQPGTATPSADAATFVAQGMWSLQTGVQSATTSAFIANQSLGWFARQAANTYQQSSFWTCSEDNQAATDARVYQITTAAIVQNGGPCASNGLVYSFQGNYGLLDITTNDEWTFTALFGGVQVKAGSGNARTTNGTTAVTGVGFAPLVVVFGTFGNASTTSITNGGHFSLGACTAAAQGQIWTADTNAADPTVNARMYNTSTVLTTGVANATGSSSSVTSQASCSSLDSDGFTLNYTTTDATARQYVWYAIGLPAASSGGERSAVY